MALNGDLIDGIFKPMKYLSEGSFGVVYKGNHFFISRGSIDSYPLRTEALENFALN